MRFGLFTTLYDCGGGAETPADVLDNLREQVVLAEQLGDDAVWMGEHLLGRTVSATPPIRSSWARPGGADEPHPDRPDGEHRAVVASDPAGGGPGDPGQSHPRPRRRRFRPRHLALRGPAVPSPRRSEEGPGEPRAVPRDRRDRAEGLDRGAVCPRRSEIHLPGPGHPVRAPLAIQPTQHGRTATGS